MIPEQHSCQPMYADQLYCTIDCQEGNNEVSWVSHDTQRCLQDFTQLGCKEISETIPYNDFYIKNWSMEPINPKPCELLSPQRVEYLRKHLSPITLAILTSGAQQYSLKNSMKSWIESGLLDVIDEVVFVVNRVTPSLGVFLAPFSEEPYNYHIIQSQVDYGSMNGFNWLITNATNDHILFVNSESRIVEPLSCIVEQLSTGIKLIESGVDVVRYRSRYNAGTPNWPEIIHKGREEYIQPSKAFCNVYHWIQTPANTWPSKMKRCHHHPLFYCTSASFCNWNMEPSLFKRDWWKQNYLLKYNEISDPEPNFRLNDFLDEETWDSRNWTISLGDGLFKFCDANFFGTT